MKAKIPEIKRDGKLVSRLIPILLIGADQVLDHESRLFIRVLARLIDKAYNEYSYAREAMLDEIKTGDKLQNRFIIINHLENCVGAIDRVSKTFLLILNGKKDKKGVRKIDYDIAKLIDNDIALEVKKSKTSKLRNRIEHIDEDIYFNKFKQGLFLDVTDDYLKIHINKKELEISELSNMIGNYHRYVLRIFNKLPNSISQGKYYRDGEIFTL